MVLQRHAHRGQTVTSPRRLAFPVRILILTLDDVAYLRSAPAAEALRAVARYQLIDSTVVADIAAVRKRFGRRAPALVETVMLRRKAAAKLKGAEDWLFTREALQQATATEVAAHRAARLAGHAVHDVTCSIGAEMAALRATTRRLLGSDLDPVRLAMARHNVTGVAVCRADALRPISRDTVVVADPGRRAEGRRRFEPRDYIPPLDALLDTYSRRDLVVKCSPGIDFDAVRKAGFHGEIEVTSLAGEVREACLWSAGLAGQGVSRRASVLRAGGGAEQVTDAEPDDCAVTDAGRWIVEPDGAVIRAGLVRHFAARHGLWQLDPKIAYLSGDDLPSGLRGFEVLERIPFGERRLRQVLAALDCGAAEILVRGLDVDPAVLRPRLRLRGTRQLSVIVTRIGTGPAARATAFVCRPSR